MIFNSSSSSSSHRLKEQVSLFRTSSFYIDFVFIYVLSKNNLKVVKHSNQTTVWTILRKLVPSVQFTSKYFWTCDDTNIERDQKDLQAKNLTQSERNQSSQNMPENCTQCNFFFWLPLSAKNSHEKCIKYNVHGGILTCVYCISTVTSCVALQFHSLHKYYFLLFIYGIDLKTASPKILHHV